MPYDGEIEVNNLPQGTIPNQADKIMLIDHETGELKQFGVASLSTVVSDVSFTNAAKNALVSLLEKVAYVDGNGQQYLNELITNLAATVTSISAVFTQGSAVIYDTDSLETLEQYLVVTASYSDGTSSVVSGYTLSGTLTVGTSTITASYGGETTTFTVTVTDFLSTLTFTKGKAWTWYGSQSSPYYNYVRVNPLTNSSVKNSRACCETVIENKGWVFTVTDSTKYKLGARNITSLETIQLAVSGETGTYTFYPGVDNGTALSESDSSDSPYVALTFSKIGDIDFTTEEINNFYGTVFTAAIPN